MSLLEDNEMLLASLQDAVERTTRTRMRENMVTILRDGCNLKKSTAEQYVTTLLKYRNHFSQVLAEADAYENKLKAKLEEMAHPPVAKPRVKSTTTKKRA